MDVPTIFPHRSFYLRLARLRSATQIVHSRVYTSPITGAIKVTPSIHLPREIPSLLDSAAGLRICNPPIRIERGGHRFVAVQTERIPSKAGKVQVARRDIGTKLLHFDPPNLPMKQQLQLFRAHSNRCFRHRRTTGRGAPGLGKRARAHSSCFP